MSGGYGRTVFEMVWREWNSEPDNFCDGQGMLLECSRYRRFQILCEFIRAVFCGEVSAMSIKHREKMETLSVSSRFFIQSNQFPADRSSVYSALLDHFSLLGHTSDKGQNRDPRR